MKFYIFMASIAVGDIIFVWLISLFYLPARGSLGLIILKTILFYPLIGVCIIQLCKLIINLTQGYIVTPQLYRLVKLYPRKNALRFLLGIIFEIVLWGGNLVSFLHFLKYSL